MPTPARRHRLGVAAILIAVSGCSIRDDPRYNPYAPPGGGKPVLQAADDTVQSAEDAVADFDARLENTLY